MMQTSALWSLVKTPQIPALMSMPVLFVVRLAAADLECAVNLLQKHDARQIVRQGDGAKAKGLVSALAHGNVNPCRPADDKSKLACAAKRQLV